MEIAVGESLRSRMVGRESVLLPRSWYTDRMINSEVFWLLSTFAIGVQISHLLTTWPTGHAFLIWALLMYFNISSATIRWR